MDVQSAVMRSDPRTAPERRLATFLQVVADLAPATGRRYRSQYQLVLDLGIWCQPAPLPADLRCWRGQAGACFHNAPELAAAVPRLLYVEGYADPGIGNGFGLEHAWTIDPETGEVRDPTWDRPGVAYLGVPISLEHREKALWEQPRRFDSPAVLDVHADPSLLTDGWPLDAGDRPT
ncbi:hypothetical protein GCM10029978_066790 [Actinoallomurus acanthiterrae]